MIFFINFGHIEKATISVTYVHRLMDDENLFSEKSEVYKNLKSVSSVLVPHCSCTEDGKTECSYNTFTPCQRDQGKEYKCNTEHLYNRKRDRVASRYRNVQGSLVSLNDYSNSFHLVWNKFGNIICKFQDFCTPGVSGVGQKIPILLNGLIIKNHLYYRTSLRKNKVHSNVEQIDYTTIASSMIPRIEVLIQGKRQIWCTYRVYV